MAFLLQLIIFTFISVAGGSRDLVILTPQEAYWKSVLPNATMPHAISDLLPSSGTEIFGTQAKIGQSAGHDGCIYWSYGCPASDDELHDKSAATRFFLKTGMQEGAKILSSHLTTSTSPSKFLPRQVADSIPFSLNKLPEILNRLSIKPNTPEATIVEETIKGCTSADKSDGEENNCVTSLESMIDFSVSMLGKEVVALSTEIFAPNPSKKELSETYYTITGVKKLVVDRSVVCHKINYAYVVFYCHETADTEVFMVSLLNVDGGGSTKANAVAVCHRNTTAWNHKHLAFQVLKVKPGTTPICHFLSQDIVAWVPYPY